MIEVARWLHACRSRAEVPTICRSLVRPAVLEQLGGSVADIFPELAKAMPATVDAMMQHGSRPVLLFRQVMGTEWITDLAIEQAQRNLFFNINGAFRNPVEGADFQARCGMLPLRWQALYRDFDSFELTSANYHSPMWNTTPFAVNARLVAARFPRDARVSQKALNDFASAIGANPFDLSCWCTTPELNMLWVDGSRNKQNVYFVPRADFNAASALRNPEDLLDRYLAFLLEGGIADTFDFHS